MRKVIKMCKYCGKEFECDKRSTKEFCSQLCKSYFNGTRIKYNCDYCGKENSDYTSHYNRKKNHFCSMECKNKWQENNLKGEKHHNYSRVKCNCSYCGKEMEYDKYRYNNNKNHYCSYECANKHRSIIYSGENHPLYNKDSHIKCNCSYCGKEMELSKYKHNNSKNHFCSRECHGKWNSENLKGEKHHSYNPNITDDERELGRRIEGYKDFTKEVYKRDNYTCQCCGDNKGHNLNAHHIYGYTEYKDLRTDANNGVTLCEECHKKYHKQYGYTNNNYKDFRTFLYNEMIKQNTLEARLFYINTIEDITLRLEIKGLIESA